MIARAVRGAIQVEQDDKERLGEAVIRLVSAIVSQNDIDEQSIVSILFSQTRDLTSANPASCLRVHGFAETPLFCTQEPEYPNSLPRVVRVLITYNAERADDRLEPVYLDGAEKLRPDVVDGSSRA